MIRALAYFLIFLAFGQVLEQCNIPKLAMDNGFIMAVMYIDLGFLFLVLMAAWNTRNYFTLIGNTFALALLGSATLPGFNMFNVGTILTFSCMIFFFSLSFQIIYRDYVIEEIDEDFW